MSLVADDSSESEGSVAPIAVRPLRKTRAAIAPATVVAAPPPPPQDHASTSKVDLTVQTASGRNTIAHYSILPSDMHRALHRVGEAAARRRRRQKRARTEAQTPAQTDPEMAPPNPNRRKVESKSAEEGESKSAEPSDQDPNSQVKEALERKEVSSSTVEGSMEWHLQGERVDYSGRSVLLAPKHMKPIPPKRCFVPKRQIFSYGGPYKHTGAVNRVRFWPGTGHLLMSCSMDHTLKLWQTSGKRKCVATYRGHKDGVRDFQFAPDGLTFVSVSYDKTVCVWDTLTGKTLDSWTCDGLPLCAAFCPEDTNQVVVGQYNKKLVQFTRGEPEAVCIYQGYHLAGVNSVTFVASGGTEKRTSFMSTSDDGKCLIWRLGEQVVQKWLQAPELPGISTVALHPNGMHWVGQTISSNHLRVGECSMKIDRLGQPRGVYNVKERPQYVGHLASGYAATCGVSPDGSLVFSGDARGLIVYWRWINPKNRKAPEQPEPLTTVKAHKQVCFGADWHPTSAQLVATCSWDGSIKLWSK